MQKFNAYFFKEKVEILFSKKVKAKIAKSALNTDSLTHTFSGRANFFSKSENVHANSSFMRSVAMQREN
jgi:hypothetical protein